MNILTEIFNIVLDMTALSSPVMVAPDILLLNPA